MAKEEAKQLKYVETQRDNALKTAAEMRKFAGEANAKVKILTEELEASLKGESATLDALKAENATLKAERDAEAEAKRVFAMEANQLRNENNGLKAEEKNYTQHLREAEAKLTALEADTEGKEKLKKRLAAKAEELRLCQNELGALKAYRAMPRSLDAQMADLITRFGPDAVIGHIMSGKVQP